MKNNFYYWIYQDVLTDEMLAKIMTNSQFEKATLIGNIIPTKETRDTDTTFLNEKEYYDFLFNYLYDANRSSGWNFDIETVEPIQFARYNVGQHYNWHIDGSSDEVAKFNTPENMFLHQKVRKVSAVLLLNDEFEGGKLELCTPLITQEGPALSFETIDLKKGSLIFFPSSTIHRVTPVTSGTRYSLVSWFLGPPFK